LLQRTFNEWSKFQGKLCESPQLTCTEVTTARLDRNNDRLPRNRVWRRRRKIPSKFGSAKLEQLGMRLTCCT